jgi:hypothetical protein
MAKRYALSIFMTMSFAKISRYGYFLLTIMIKESFKPIDTLDALKKQVRKHRILKDGRK